jgi:hypothetical protein
MVAAVKLCSHPSGLGYPGLLLLAGLLLWILAAWPLPRLFSEVIPHTNLNPEQQTVQPIVPGDHLQLLYRFWLGLDALTGHSPWFHNIYEFNLGDDAARVQPYLYYLPFSLVYMAVAPWAGHAAGWNASGLASILLAITGLGLLARRFAREPGAGLWATLLAASFPYAWITLFTGSPTGFAMAFPPWLFYGLDRAIRDRAIRGSVLAGLALFCAYSSDLHVAFFSFLAAPFFALLSLGRAYPDPRRWPGAIRSILLPLLPCLVLGATTIAISTLLNRQLSGSVMGAGRSLAEMASYSPPARGLISTARSGMANHVYFGIPLFILLVALPAIAGLFRDRHVPADPTFRRDWAVVGLLAAAVTVVVLLALGIHGPGEGLPVRLIRRIVPKYAMIRQTVKIYCLMPALLSPLLGLLISRLLADARRSAWGLGAAGLVLGLSLWTVGNFLAQTTPGFSRLPHRNSAYAAVAADDQANAGRPPHALAIPLWPGDSHWSSLYEYGVMLSRVRLVNGYTPAVPAGYLENVFLPYASLNQGHATGEQLDGLLALGVRHLIVHAGAFPEKVSPFPAASTQRAHVSHPRHALIADDVLNFAFRIFPQHPVEHTPHANWAGALYAAARHWSWEPPLLLPEGQTAPLLLRSPVAPAPNRRFLLRLAHGSAQPLLIAPSGQGSSAITHPVPNHPDWLQADMPGPTGGQAHAYSGPVTLQHALLVAGDLPAPDPDGSIHISPALLFHTGHCTPGQDDVTFDPATVPARCVLYGPNLPFPPGVYDITFSCSLPSGAPEHEPLGIFRLLTLPGPRLVAEAAFDSTTAAITFPAVTVGAEPLRFEFHYTAQAPVVLRAIHLVPSRLQLVPAS